jgi:hypothetical protein
MIYAITGLEACYQSVYDYVSGPNAQFNLMAVSTDFLHSLIPEN